MLCFIYKVTYDACFTYDCKDFFQIDSYLDEHLALAILSGNYLMIGIEVDEIASLYIILHTLCLSF